MRMLLALALVALSLAFAAYAQTCRPQVCVGEGDECLPFSDCANGFADSCQKQCPIGTTCLKTNPDGILRCIQSSEGFDCDTGAECFALYGPEIACSALRFCVPINFNLIPNDFCESNEDCQVVAGNNVGECLDGRCRGNIAGAACGNDEDCNQGMYCPSTNVCTAQVASGAPCSNDNECLGLSLTCGPQGTCQQIFSGTLQTACSSDQDCGSGLGCASGICNDVSSVSAVVGADCSTDPNICSNTGLLTCACNQVTGTSECIGAVNQCTEELVSLFACGDANLCHHDDRDDIFNGDLDEIKEGNCLYHECRGDYDAYVDCINGDDLVPTTVDPSCTPVGRSAASQLSFLLW